ncbi:hypothetical protein EGR_10993 [Echinococcus granulosus]|uniref:Uncharacterized protein n=1 Tax=Echinococcus granulosus TaxID=6210 RepID=W6TZJ5_ECHGR|nr:hypothetical protein EGR_10993 [Echinococcus granulosus]EUB54148.1 hypothetical protein EGR_10993 [Echinococcus granulosus]
MAAFACSRLTTPLVINLAGAICEKALKEYFSAFSEARGLGKLVLSSLPNRIKLHMFINTVAVINSLHLLLFGSIDVFELRPNESN